MKLVSARAPGKAVLSGEYVVLSGAPAIAMAVRCFANVKMKPAGADAHCVSMPGLVSGSWRFRTHGREEIEWLDTPPPGGSRLIEAAWKVCEIEVLPPQSITIDTRQFYDTETGKKVGLGSSAAATVALVSALSQFASQPSDLSALAANAHRVLQGGLGSGVDIATSLEGGVIAFRKDRVDLSQPLNWPKGLAYRILWSGRPVDTASRLRQLGDAPKNESSRQSLSDAAEQILKVWCAGDVSELLNMFGSYTKVLRRFSDDHDLGVFDAGHGAMTDLAVASRSIYKPCGAGGGDIGIAMASSDAVIEEFCAEANTLGFHSLPAKLELSGVSGSVETRP